MIDCFDCGGDGCNWDTYPNAEGVADLCSACDGTGESTTQIEVGDQVADMITLTINWAAYTSEHFDPIYEAHSERTGHRPTMSIRHGGEHAIVATTTADADAVRDIIKEVEEAAL
jgi:hypothetical protein